MARKKRSPPSGDGARSSRPQKRAKSTSRSVGPTSGFSENATGSSRLEVEVMNHKIEDQLQLAFQKMEELTQTEFNELKENLSIFQNPPDTNQSESFSENTTGSSRLKLEAIQNRKIDELQLAFQKRVQTEVNELKEKLSIPQNPPDTNQSESEQVDHDRYEIKIIGAIKDCVHTGSKVEGKKGGFLKVAICCNDKKVTSEPFASAKFEILVVKGEFCEEGSWTAETFQGSLVEAREEVGSILKNNSISKFAGGEAVLDNLIFIDNSSWVRGKKWRLGIRLLEGDGVRVVEAISNCFRVYDRHRKASEKLHPPSLTTGVGRLEKVGKKRASDLKKNKIRTVKHFLRLFHRNQSCLLKILGINSEDDESWKTMIRHAKECNVGSNLYSYRKNNSVLFFDSVYELVGAEFGNRYRSFEKLNDSRKTLVNKWKKGFYKYIKMGNIADFEMVNGQPVPIEHDSTIISADDNAQQIDRTAEALDRQPADNTHSLSYDAVPAIRRDTDQNIVSDHNADQTAGALDIQPADNTRSLSYDSVPDTGRDADQNIVADHNAGENNNSTQEFSDENSSQLEEQESAFVPLNSTVEISAKSARENTSVEESYQVENMEGLSDVEDIELPSREACDEILRTLDDFLSRHLDIVKKWAILQLVSMFVLNIRRRSGEDRHG